MNDDLSGTLDLAEAGNQGQSEGNNVQKFTDADVRALQSTLNKREEEAKRDAAQARREAQEATRRAEQITIQAQAMLAALQDTNPEAAEFAIAQAALAEKDAELEYYRSRVSEQEEREAARQAELQAQESARNWWTTTAQSLGVDAYSPEFTSAVQKTIDEGNPVYAQRAMMKLSGQMQASARDEEADFVPPPSGGAGVGGSRLTENVRDALHRELNSLYNEPTKHARRIAEIKSKLK
jgi:hypothetical protein